MACKAIDDCDRNHCHICGNHIDGDGCDECEMNRAWDEADAITQAFNGNYEQAALWAGW